MSEWIDVSDRLPPVGVNVLTTILLNSNLWSEPEISHWYYKLANPDMGRLMCTSSFVKKWMPLPDLPKK